MGQVTTAKSHAADSIRYDSLSVIRFPDITLGASSTLQASVPLPANVKILALSALLRALWLAARRSTSKWTPCLMRARFLPSVISS